MKKYIFFQNKVTIIMSLYFLFGSGLILFLSRFSDNSNSENYPLSLWGQLIPWIFLFITGLIIYYVISRELKKSEIAEQNLNEIQKRFSDIVNQEKLLKESEERYRSLADLTFEGLVIHDNGVIIDCNAVFQKMSGYSREELLGRNIFDMIPQKYHKLIQDKSQLDFVPPYEFEGITKSGKIIWFETTARTAQIGNKTYRVAALRDISWRKEAESKLKESEERYRGIFNTYSSGIIIFNPDNDIVMANPAACEIYGYGINEIKKLKIEQITTEDVTNLHTPKIFNAFSRGTTSEFESKDIKKDGTGILTHIILSPFIYNNSQHILAIIDDITEKKRVQEELQKHKNHLEILVKERTNELSELNRLLEKEIQKQKEAEAQVKNALKKEKELSELKSGFLSMTSHEFRTPLTSILSSADLLAMAGKNYNETRFNHHINKIRNSVKNMTTLLNDVLTISRSKDGKIFPNFTPVNIQSFLHDIIYEIKNLTYYQHKIELTTTDLEEKICIDPKLFRQCVENLVINAIKYSPQNSSIFINADKNKNYLSVEIKDSGPGIEKVELKNIFEPFYRINPKAKSLGSGLGLAIVKNAVEILGGTINVESVIGAGTTFRIIFPIKNGEKGNESENSNN